MLRVFFSVGEPSGDLHGANLIRQLRHLDPQIRSIGLGGPKMAQAGCELQADLTELAVMWFSRVVWNVHRFWSLLRQAEMTFRYQRPDAVVLIDYPGFNWWVARRAKVYGIPVFYYGAPQIWAWASWRVGKMRRLVDHVLCKLPFETRWYRERGCPASYVGHPYFDDMHGQQLDQRFLLDIRGPRPLLTLLPGSRRQEVEANLPAFLKTAAIVRRTVPDVRVAIASFNDSQAEIARQFIRHGGYARDKFELHVGRTRELIHAADCCLACSGSVSLELLYEAKPTVIHYGIGRFAYRLQNLFRRVKFITLVNLLAVDDPFRRGTNQYDPDLTPVSEVPFPEYLTHEDRSSQMAHHLIRWLVCPSARQAAGQRLEELKNRIVQLGASERAACFIVGTLRRRPRPTATPASSSLPKVEATEESEQAPSSANSTHAA
jgi:lipid-A-disaccharide synthase